MKKYLVLISLLFIPFMVSAKTCDIDKITIESISLENKSNSVQELSKATANKRNLKLDLGMSEIGDVAKYKIIIKNDSDEDYELAKQNLNSDYIEYTLETENNSQIIKANSSKTIILKAEYKKEIPASIFINGKYNDNKIMKVNLTNDQNTNILDTIKNPQTSHNLYLIFVIVMLIIGIVLFNTLRKKKYAKFLILFIVTIIILPISVHAICKCEIQIESNVAVSNIAKFYVKDYDKTNKYLFIDGMTWEEFIQSDYNVDNWTITNYYLKL